MLLCTTAQPTVLLFRHSASPVPLCAALRGQELLACLCIHVLRAASCGWLRRRCTHQCWTSPILLTIASWWVGSCSTILLARETNWNAFAGFVVVRGVLWAARMPTSSQPLADLAAPTAAEPVHFMNNVYVPQLSVR